jgi:DNA polymerase
VPGEGNPNAEVLFIGEGPGHHEDQQGRPFVGPAGKLLDELIESIGLTRQDVYITNVVKCRPPGNRDPLPAETEACKHWLDSQVQLIRPTVIATLGRYSMAKFLPKETISKIHGTPRRIGGHTVLPLHHPAAALYQGSLRKTLEEDFAKIPALLKRAASAPPPPPSSEPVQAPKLESEEPKQLGLF